MQHRSWSVLLILAACGGSAAPPAEEPAPAPAPTAADLGPLCDRFYERERACVDPYLEALLDVRLEYDQPPGIVAEVEAQGRAAVLDGVRADWEVFTTLEATDEICRAIETRTPAGDVDRLWRDGNECLATTDCEAFARCAVETERTYIQSGDQH